MKTNKAQMEGLANGTGLAALCPLGPRTDGLQCSINLPTATALQQDKERGWESQDTLAACPGHGQAKHPVQSLGV